jgi:large subunit ribosomal protein L22
MEFKAILKYGRISEHKARLVANLVRGKNVSQVQSTLAFLDKKAGYMINKLVASAVANAANNSAVNVDKLFIKSITVDQGPVLKRFRPRAQGRATGVRKRTSHIAVTLGER